MKDYTIGSHFDAKVVRAIDGPRTIIFAKGTEVPLITISLSDLRFIVRESMQQLKALDLELVGMYGFSHKPKKRAKP